MGITQLRNSMAFVYSSLLNRRIHFQESLVASVSGTLESAAIRVLQTADNVDIASSHPTAEHFLLTRPSFCPFYHLSDSERELISQNNPRFRHVPVAVSVLLYDVSSHHVLLTRRSPHLRAFPYLWVPPGGHVDTNEDIHTAVLRELFEETGIDLRHSETSMDVTTPRLKPLCAWESAYPTHLVLGGPIRHHLVLYYALPCSPHLASVWTQKTTQTELNSELPPPDDHFSQLALDEDTLAGKRFEVDAYAWLSPQHCREIVASYEDLVGKEKSTENISVSAPHFKCWRLQENGKFQLSERPIEVLTNMCLPENAEDTEAMERVSTGTKYALLHYLRWQGYLS